MKNIRNLFKLKNKNETMKGRTFRYMKTLSERQEEDYYKSIRVDNFQSKNYVEYESNGDGNKALSVKEHLGNIKSYMRNIIINIQKSDTWKILLPIAINFISSKDVDEEHVMYSKSSNIEFMTCNNVNEVVNELFESSLLRYEIDLEIQITKKLNLSQKEFQISNR